MNGDMTVTAPRGQAVWRAPRARLLVNGAERAETGLEHFTLTRTRYSRADTLEMGLALDRTKIPASGPWFDLKGAAVAGTDIQLQMRDAARPGAQWTTLFAGVMDHVELSPAETVVRIACRDYLARLLDMRVVDGWLNMTAAEVVTAMVTAAGLAPRVSMPGGMVGQFWQVGHLRMSAPGHSRFQTAFDLACYLATTTGCDLYAEGKTITCVPPATPDATNTHVLDYTDTGPASPLSMGASGLCLARDCQIARGVVVHVMSWDSRQRTRIDYYWSATGGSTQRPAGGAELHGFTLPGARLDLLRQYAQARYNQIVAHERTITGRIPGRLDLAPRQFMRLSGTGTTWDGTLGVDAVSSHFSWEDGFSQQVTLRTRNVMEGDANDD